MTAREHNVRLAGGRVLRVLDVGAAKPGRWSSGDSGVIPLVMADVGLPQDVRKQPHPVLLAVVGIGDLLLALTLDHELVFPPLDWAFPA